MTYWGSRGTHNNKESLSIRKVVPHWVMITLIHSKCKPCGRRWKNTVPDYDYHDRHLPSLPTNMMDEMFLKAN